MRAVVTGGGSGVGRAVALRLAGSGWSVAVLGRRAQPLNETAALRPAGLIRAEQCDITDADAVARVRDRLRDDWKAIDAVVNTAGVNIPRRSWSDVSPEDFRNVVATNLFGPFLVTRAFLPLLRGQAGATVVTIVSDAGLLGSAKAGVPYVAAKFGQTGLVESLNAELRDRGVRACGIFPGDIDTAMLDDRAVPPTREQRAGMLQPEDVAECVMLAITLPPRAIVEKLVVRPR